MQKVKLLYLNETQIDYQTKINLLKKDPMLRSIDDNKALEYVKNIECDYITIFEKNYPKILKLLPEAPLIIYYEGNINLLNKNLVAIIGVTNPCDYSKRATMEVVSELDNNKAIISNYSYGNSHLAILYAVKNKQNIVATLSYGFSYVDKKRYKLLNEVLIKGLVISIVPYFSKSSKYNYYKNIEISVMLSETILIMQSKKNSTMMQLVNSACEYNKEIYVLPGSIYDPEFLVNNELIQDGANLIYKGIRI